MKNIVLFVLLCSSTISNAQIAFTSFEEAPVFSIEYTDTGDANVAHDLINNPDEPFVDYTSVGGEMGFDARYVPYDSPGDGLTDGDYVGVTDQPPSAPFTNGLQGYEISDVDGNFILEFDAVFTTSPTITLDYFISETGYEGDGTVNASGSDRLRIYVKDLDTNLEYDLLDTTGHDINDLGIEGVWNTLSLSIEDSPNTTVQLIIEGRTNSGSEAFYFDNIVFDQQLETAEIDHDHFFLFPNPVNQGSVNISSNTTGPYEISIYNILGEKVISRSLLASMLDVSYLNSGIYLVHIEQDEYAITKKLIVK